MIYLIALIFNSLYIVGLYQSFQDGNIFARFNPYPHLNKWKPSNVFLKQLFKPVIGCVVCMASVHGLIFLFVFKNYIYIDIPIVIFYIFALAGINRIWVVIADL